MDLFSENDDANLDIECTNQLFTRDNIYSLRSCKIIKFGGMTNSSIGVLNVYRSDVKPQVIIYDQTCIMYNQLLIQEPISALG